MSAERITRKQERWDKGIKEKKKLCAKKNACCQTFRDSDVLLPLEPLRESEKKTEGIKNATDDNELVTSLYLTQRSSYTYGVFGPFVFYQHRKSISLRTDNYLLHSQSEEVFAISTADNLKSNNNNNNKVFEDTDYAIKINRK